MDKSVRNALIAASVLLTVYFSVLTLVSGWKFALFQFSSFWYFILSLALGFGIQIGLYTYLKKLIREENGSKKVIVVSGTTSTAAMISCCTHYLANILPILGITGALTIVSQYQVQIFWIGIIANIFGITFISSRIIKFLKSRQN